MKKKDKYIITIIILSTLLLINFIIIIVLSDIATDLRDTAQMYENSKNVCSMELKDLENDYEELLDMLEEK